MGADGQRVAIENRAAGHFGFLVRRSAGAVSLVQIDLHDVVPFDRASLDVIGDDAGRLQAGGEAEGGADA